MLFCLHSWSQQYISKKKLPCLIFALGNQICDALHDLVPFAQFKKREKHPWRSVNFSKVKILLLKLKLN